MATVTPRTGTVDSFDDAAGLGEVIASDGRRYRFHCTQVADGSRSIEPGTRVAFEVVAGHQGVWEAARLREA